MSSTTPSSGSISTPPSTWPPTSRKSSEKSMLVMLTSSIVRGNRKLLENTRFDNHHIISDKIILNNALDVEKGSSDINSALKYFNSITEYMMQLRTALGELRDDIE